VRFQVFRDGKCVDGFILSGAYLFGTDGIAIRRGEIRFAEGFIECRKPNMETGGLALLWPVEGFGEVLLPTTCLPEREKPYNLNVEIARAKLMQIINKREEWSFFDKIHGLSHIAEEAQSLFIRSIQNISSPETASELANESLKKAIVFSEKIAAKQAESFFAERSTSHGFGRGCLGCKVNPAQINQVQYVGKLLELFKFVTIPINWAQVEHEKGEYDFSAIDSCVKVLTQKKIAIGAGPVLCFAKEQLPGWLVESGDGFETIREAAYDFVLKTVTRYRDKVRLWRVLGGLNALNYFSFSFEQSLEMTRAVNMAVKASSEKALKIVEIGNPWGEYYGSTSGTIPPLVYMDMILQSGMNFDAFGVQMRFGKNAHGMHVRDMMHISSVLDYFGAVAKPLHITEVEVPSASCETNGGNSAGIWHQQWDQSQQAEWIGQFYKIALSKPCVNTVTYSSLTDGADNVIAGSGLLTEQLKEKRSFQTLRKLKEVIFSR